MLELPQIAGVSQEIVLIDPQNDYQSKDELKRYKRYNLTKFSDSRHLFINYSGYIKILDTYAFKDLKQDARFDSSSKILWQLHKRPLPHLLLRIRSEILFVRLEERKAHCLLRSQRRFSSMFQSIRPRMVS